MLAQIISDHAVSIASAIIAVVAIVATSVQSWLFRVGDRRETSLAQRFNEVQSDCDKCRSQFIERLGRGDIKFDDMLSVINETRVQVGEISGKLELLLDLTKKGSARINH